MPAYTLDFAAVRTRQPWEKIPPLLLRFAAGDDLRVRVTLYERDGDAQPLDLADSRSGFWLRRPDGRRMCGFTSALEPDEEAAGQILVDLAPWGTNLTPGRYLWGIRTVWEDGGACVVSGVAVVAPGPWGDAPGYGPGSPIYGPQNLVFLQDNFGNLFVDGEQDVLAVIDYGAEP